MTEVHRTTRNNLEYIEHKQQNKCYPYRIFSRFFFHNEIPFLPHAICFSSLQCWQAKKKRAKTYRHILFVEQCKFYIILHVSQSFVSNLHTFIRNLFNEENALNNLCVCISRGYKEAMHWLDRFSDKLTVFQIVTIMLMN